MGMVASVRSGMLTFVFTDIEQSTMAWDRHGPQMNDAMARHDALLREIVDVHHGSVFSHGGDGIAAVFVRAADAVEASCDVQRAVAAEPWPEPIALRLRVALHTGVAELRDGHYFGSDVHRAARVMSLAQGGQVLITAATAVLAGRGPWTIVDLGRHRLRGFDGAEQVFRIVVDGLPDVDSVVVPHEAVGNLPRTTTALIGRTEILDQIQFTLEPGALVTLVGAGGVGKTRLAVAAAWAASGYQDGTWFVDLTAASADAVVIAVTEAALGLYTASVRRSSEEIAQALAGQARLLVLDNCEHVIDAAARLAGELRDRCPRCAVLATSREPLGVDGERVISVEPLGTTSDAIELLTTRIAARLPSFEPTLSDHAALEGICRLVDGLPLAVELAAARVPPLGLDAVHTELARSVDLVDRRRGVPVRHRSLRDTVAWSYGLLADDERLLLERLSVFAGTFDLADAQAVCVGPPMDGRVTDLLVALVDKSLVAVLRNSGQPRYKLLEVVRHFATGQLEQRGGTDGTLDRVVDYYVGWVERADAGVRGPDEAFWHHAYLAEWDNLRRAFRLAVARGNVDAAMRIVWHCHAWALQRWFFEFGEWAEASVAMPEASAHPAYPIALVALCWSHKYTNPDPAAYEPFLRQAQDHEASHGPAPAPVVPYALALQAASRGDAGVATASTEEVRRRDDSMYWRIYATHLEWSVPTTQVQVGTAGPALIDATRSANTANVLLAEQHGNPTMLTLAYWYAACVEPDPRSALTLIECAMAIAHDVGNLLAESQAAVDLVRIYCALDRNDDALAFGQSFAERCRRANALTIARYMCLSLLPTLVAARRYNGAAVVAAALLPMSHAPVLRSWYLPDDVMAALHEVVSPERLEQLSRELAVINPGRLINRLCAAIADRTDADHATRAHRNLDVDLR